MTKNFWINKKLSSMSLEEWEALCDGCGKCCLEKLEDDETDEVFYTKVTCKILDIKTCRCLHYKKRHEFIPECLPITLANEKVFLWLPESCAYRLLHEGKKLPSWHHLISGDRQTVHSTGNSIRDWAVPQEEEMDLEEYIIADIPF